MNIQKMLKQAQQMQAKLQEVQGDLETREVEGTSGGGAVKLTLTGKGHLSKISLDASMVNADEKEMLEDLIIAAHRDAKEKMDAMVSDAMGAVTGGLPAGMKLPF